MRKGFTLIEVLVVAVIVAVLAAVAIPAYNAYIKGSKEKVALNYAATIAQSAGTWYSQSQSTPTVAQLNVKAPSGYAVDAIADGNIVVRPDNTTPGYSTGDFDPQTVAWK